MLKPLQSLIVYGDRNSAAGALTLLRSPHMSSLRELTLNDLENHSRKPLAEIARSEAAGEIRSLTLCCNTADLTLLAPLFADGAFPRLWSLTIDAYSMPGSGLETLCRSPLLSRLRRLHIIGNEIDPAEIDQFATSEAASNLRDLRLSFPFGVTRAASQAILKAPHLQNLKRLHIRTDLRKRTPAGLIEQHASRFHVLRITKDD